MTLGESITMLYEKCRLLSGSFDHQPLFAEIVVHGDEALPRLFADLLDEEMECYHPWVIFSLLHAITGPRRPIPQKEDQGRLVPIRDMWLQWGRENGFTA